MLYIIIVITANIVCCLATYLAGNANLKLFFLFVAHTVNFTVSELGVQIIFDKLQKKLISLN